MVNVRVTATGRMPRVEFHARRGEGGRTTPTARRRRSGGRTAARKRTTPWKRSGKCGSASRFSCPVIRTARPSTSRPCDRGAAARVDAGAVVPGLAPVPRSIPRSTPDSVPARPGPFIVEEMDCTVVVPPGWSAALDERGFILMSRSGLNQERLPRSHVRGRGVPGSAGILPA